MEQDSPKTSKAKKCIQMTIGPRYIGLFNQETGLGEKTLCRPQAQIKVVRTNTSPEDTRRVSISITRCIALACQCVSGNKMGN